MAGASGSNEDNERLISALATDHGTAEVDAADRAMLDYAARLTLDPGGEHGPAVDGLKAHGFDDRAIHDVCAVTAYYAFVNRIADGLGVELEDEGG